MRFFQRLSDILSANVSELIERYEDPELLLKQAVREMEESVRVALAHAVKVVAHEKVLARQLAAEEAAIATWRKRAAEAVDHGDDDAARQALRRKRDSEVLCASLARQLAEAAEAGQTLRRQIEALRLRTDEARRKLALLSARQRAAEARQRLLREFSTVPIGEDGFQKFERMCRRVEQMEAETEALVELSGSSECTAWDNFERAAADDVEAELASLKGAK